MRTSVGCLAGALLGLVATVASAEQSGWKVTVPSGWSASAQPGGGLVVQPAEPQEAAITAMLLPTQPLEADFEAQYARERQRVEAAMGLRDAKSGPGRKGRTGQARYKLDAAVYASDRGPVAVLLLARAEEGAFGLMVVLSDPTAPSSTSATLVQMFMAAALTAPAGVTASKAPPAELPGRAPDAPPPPQQPQPQGAIALRFDVPAGWTQNGAVVRASAVVNGRSSVLEILPAVPVQESLVQTFQAQWRALMPARFTSTFSPLPLRLKNGAGQAILFDVDNQARELPDGNWIGAGLYLVSDGQMAVPVVARLADLVAARAELATFFANANLGTGRRAGPLFSQAEVTGTWRSSASSMATLVDAAGNYRGDASMASGETLDIAATGACTSAFAAVRSNGGTLRDKAAGRCSVEDTMLTVPGSEGARRYRLTGVGRSRDGARFMFLGITRDDYPFLNASSQGAGGGDVYVAR